MFTICPHDPNLYFKVKKHKEKAATKISKNNKNFFLYQEGCKYVKTIKDTGLNGNEPNKNTHKISLTTRNYIA